MFHKEGYKIILTATLSIVAIIVLAYFFIEISWVKWLVIAATLVFYAAILQFFRNPTRETVADDKAVYSPVDGKVVVIEKVHEKEYFKEERLLISVFMSPINVHVTRYPIAGKVLYSKYHPGKYLVAWHPKSSEENERTTVVLQHENETRLLYRQIAGAMAKRIVNYAEEDTTVHQGADSGFIKFGSRVDVYLPADTPVKVSINDKVKGGVSVLASLD